MVESLDRQPGYHAGKGTGLCYLLFAKNFLQHPGEQGDIRRAACLHDCVDLTRLHVHRVHCDQSGPEEAHAPQPLERALVVSGNALAYLVLRFMKMKVHRDIELVHRFGRPEHTAGRLRITLEGVAWRPEVPHQAWRSAASVVIIETTDGWIVTVYRLAVRRR